MTNLDPKHLDALDAKLASQIGDDVQVIFNHEYLFKQARDTITALRAENDRLSNLWQIEHDHATALRAQIDRERAATIEAAVRRIEPAANADDLPKSVLRMAQGSIRALRTDATSAAMDAIRREAREQALREAKALFVEGSAPHMAIIALAASIPPDPDTNAG